MTARTGRCSRTSAIRTMPLCSLDDLLIVTLDQRLGLEILQEVHARVGEIVIVRFERLPSLPAER